MSSKVDIKTLDELNKMHTGTLMSRRTALLKCEETFEQSDRYDHEVKPNTHNTDIIEYKDTHQWKQAYNELKSVLDTRENLPNKQERKTIRKQKSRAFK